MSGVPFSLDVSARQYSESGVMPLSTAGNMQNAEPLLIVSLREIHRITKTRIYMDMLSIKERKHFYNETVELVLECPTRNLIAPNEAPRRVAMLYDINIAECDRAKIRVKTSNYLRAAKMIAGLLDDIPSEPTDVDATANNGHETRGAKRRRECIASVVAKKSVADDGIDTLPSSKL